MHHKCSDSQATRVCAGRLTKKERRQTLTEELLADQVLQQGHKRRFAKLQVRTWHLASFCSPSIDPRDNPAKPAHLDTRAFP
jgi:hypothetical protein